MLCRKGKASENTTFQQPWRLTQGNLKIVASGIVILIYIMVKGMGLSLRQEQSLPGAKVIYSAIDIPCLLTFDSKQG
ncbi:MAG TPA: hypothetical protein VGD98_11140 [Ktedonobacteraceae bacterium]